MIEIEEALLASPAGPNPQLEWVAEEYAAAGMELLVQADKLPDLQREAAQLLSMSRRMSFDLNSNHHTPVELVLHASTCELLGISSNPDLAENDPI